MDGLRCEYCNKGVNKKDLLVVWLRFYKIRFYHKGCYAQALKKYFSLIVGYKFFILNSSPGRVAYFLTYILGVILLSLSAFIYTKVNLMIGILYTFFFIFIIANMTFYIYTYRKYSKYFGS